MVSTLILVRMSVNDTGRDADLMGPPQMKAPQGQVTVNNLVWTMLKKQLPKFPGIIQGV